jgi:hypothetical protein
MKFIHLLNLGYDNQSWTILKSKMFVEANNSKKCSLFFEMLALLKKENTLHFMPCNAMHSSVTLHIVAFFSLYILVFYWVPKIMCVVVVGIVTYTI